MSIITTLRSFRIAGIAVFDVVLSIIGLLITLRFFKPNRPQHFYLSWALVLVFPIAIITHLLLGIPTTLNYYMGLSQHP
jgi:hypothetical protein